MLAETFGNRAQQASRLPPAKRGRPPGKQNAPKTDKKLVVDAEPKVKGTNQQISIVAFPQKNISFETGSQEEKDYDDARLKLVKAMQVVSDSFQSLIIPERFLGQNAFGYTGSHVKRMFAVNSMKQNNVLKAGVQDTLDDSLMNALDLIASMQSNFSYCLVYRKINSKGIISFTQIYQDVEFISILPKMGMPVGKNVRTNYELKMIYSGSVEATTNDIPDIAAYIYEKFKI